MQKATHLVHSPSLAAQVHRVLHVLFFAILLIVIRLWYLGIVARQQRLQDAERPWHRVLFEPAKRASISDRFGIPLAINQLNYQATIVYSQLREIPGVRWVRDANGKRQKKAIRKEYIQQLANFLGKELQMDPERIEDLIHSKAALYFHLPFILKDSLTEKEYYRLKMAEKDWVGLEIRKAASRSYPFGRTAGEVIGYMGAINRQEYEGILAEVQSLKEELTKCAYGKETESFEGYEKRLVQEQRLHCLEERAYSLNDSVGKTGVEATFEEDLRGYRGKKHYCADAKGRFLSPLPGSYPPQPGKKLTLTVSAELQEFAEKLLIQNEEIREILATPLDGEKKTIHMKKEPWMRGGAIVAMDPRNGEILTIASNPRFDPNDFIRSLDPAKQQKKKERIDRWFENERLLTQIWNQERPLEKEHYDWTKKNICDQECFLSWQQYLQFLLPIDSPLFLAFAQLNSLQKVVAFQQTIDSLLTITDHPNLHYLLNAIYRDEDHMAYDNTPSIMERRHIEKICREKEDEIQKIKNKLNQVFSLLPYHYDKILLIDLCRVAVDADRLPSTLLAKIDPMDLNTFRSLEANFLQWEKQVQLIVKEVFHKETFRQWKEQEQALFLKERRKEEQVAGRYPRPYLDYVDQKEKELFREFWQEYRLVFLLSAFFSREELLSIENALPPAIYLQRLKEKQESIPFYRVFGNVMHALDVFEAQVLFGSFRSYGNLVRPLYGKYRSLQKRSGGYLEKDLAAAFYPRYGYGCARSHAFRQATIQGSIFKIVTAYEALHQLYHKKDPTSLAEMNPLTMVDQVFRKGGTTYVGYTMEGKPIAQAYRGGRLPRSHTKAMGTVDVWKAIERSSNPYFSLLAADVLDSPNDLIEAAKKFSYGRKTGIDLPFEIAGQLPSSVDIDRTQLYAFAIGQGNFVATPLQSAVMLSTFANGGVVWKPQILQCKEWVQDGRTVEERTHPTPQDGVCLPPLVREALMKGMEQMVERSRKIHGESLLKTYQASPDIVHDFLKWDHRFIGKTSTSEVVEAFDLGLKEGRQIFSHVWFGGILFLEEGKKEGETFTFSDSFGEPELVVIVYLRYGGFGKEAAPLALQIAKKWKEIQSRTGKVERQKQLY